MGSSRQTLSTAAATAEIVGTIAVVVSLLLVGQEMRRSTAARQAATYQEIVRSSNEFLLALASDSALASIVTRHEADPATLNDEETHRYFNYVRVFWRNMDNAFVQHERGVLADAEWEVYRGIACENWMESQDGEWALHRDYLSPGFVSLMGGC